jgi:PKD repeat protein
MKRLLILTLAGAFLTIGACKKDKVEAPTAEDAQFTYTTSSQSDNIILFTASNAELIAQWDFGDGNTGEGTTVEAQYPLAGSYDVTLTVFNEAGQASSTQTIVIDQDDPTLLDDPIYNLLTGGIDVGSKTWVLDSNNSGHFGVGPNPVGAGGLTPEWWAASCNEKPNTGLYSDQYTFTLQGFGFDMYTNGLVYVDDQQSANFPNSYENLGDYSAPYDNVLGETWKVEVGDDTTLTVSGGFMGFYTGVTEYRILRLSENEMFLRYLDVSDAGLSWYIRLVPEGYDAGTDCEPGGGTNDSTAYALPIDFESEDNVFTTFGGSTYQVTDNPDASGINTSARVLETVHGDQTWAGLFVDLLDPLDFSTNSSIAVKIWAPSTGTLRIKLEDQLSSTTFVEKDVTVGTANQWIEVSIDFAGEDNGVYNRLVLFPGWDVANAGTFYLDDISQQ